MRRKSERKGKKSRIILKWKCVNGWGKHVRKCSTVGGERLRKTAKTYNSKLVSPVEIFPFSNHFSCPAEYVLHIFEPGNAYDVTTRGYQIHTEPGGGSSKVHN